MGERTDSHIKSEEKGKRIDLSLAQVAGSALAAAIAAFLAGRLGVYGTIIGAGVVSVVATTGGSIFQHLFRRTGEQIKEAATVTTRPKPRRRQEPARGNGKRSPSAASGPAGAASATMVLPTFSRTGTEDEITSVAAAGAEVETPVLRTAPDDTAPGNTTPANTSPRALTKDELLARDDETRLLPPGATDRTQLVPRLDDHALALRTTSATTDSAASAPGAAPVPGAAFAPETASAPGTPPVPDEEFGRRTYGTRLRGRRRTWLAALAVFILAMAVVTGVELLTGHDASGGKGTSVSNVFHPGRSHDSTPSTPATPSPSTSTDGSSSGGTSDDPTPQPDATDSGTGSDSGSGSDTDNGSDNGTDQGTAMPSPSTGDDGDSSAEPTPTPSEDTGDDQSSDTDTGSTGDEARAPTSESP